MLSFSPKVLENQRITHNLLNTLAQIHEFKGKEELFKHQSPQVLDSLRHVAMIQSTESSNRIEGITAPPERVRALVEDKTTPSNRSEQEISGYRDVLDTIHSSYEGMEFTPNVVLQLHQGLYRYTGMRAGGWKSVDNEITEHLPNGDTRLRFAPVSAFDTPHYMEGLHQQFGYQLARRQIEPLLLIATYILDFLCVHPFLDGNGRMARLLTLTLLYKEGYGVGRYVSLEKIVEESKETYYEALLKSSHGWHDKEHSLLPWWEYFLGVVLVSYREFEKRMGQIAGEKGTKTQIVLSVLDSLPDEFAISDIRALCPHVGIDLIRRVLRAQRDAQRLMVLGRGPAARWRKVYR